MKHTNQGIGILRGSRLMLGTRDRCGTGNGNVSIGMDGSGCMDRRMFASCVASIRIRAVVCGILFTFFDMYYTSIDITVVVKVAQNLVCSPTLDMARPHHSEVPR